MPHKLAEVLVARARAADLTLATAESCTGGLVAAAITEVAGSSDVFDCGFVTYSNRSKTELLGVAGDLLARHGAVSLSVAAAMAEGAVERAGVQLAVSITGIAGPGGGSEEKPVGLVCFGLARPGVETRAWEMRFGDLGRAAVRQASVREALEMLLAAI
jgi:nicotinamide-nucleotide amidase